MKRLVSIGLSLSLGFASVVAQQVEKASIAGTVSLMGSGEPLPDENRNRPDLFKRVLTDQNGRFTIADIAPGSYKLFARQDLEAIFLVRSGDPEA